MMHPKVANAIQEIDAAVFNGPTFDEPEARAELTEYIERWTRRLGSADAKLCFAELAALKARAEK